MVAGRVAFAFDQFPTGLYAANRIAEADRDCIVLVETRAIAKRLEVQMGAGRIARIAREAQQITNDYLLVDDDDGTAFHQVCVTNDRIVVVLDKNVILMTFDMIVIGELVIGDDHDTCTRCVDRITHVQVEIVSEGIPVAAKLAAITLKHRVRRARRPGQDICRARRRCERLAIAKTVNGRDSGPGPRAAAAGETRHYYNDQRCSFVTDH